MDKTEEQKSGIYIHIPFCVKKCSYCDFYSVTDMDSIPAFIEALGREIEISGTLPSEVNSIYIGGGTPSLLDPKSIDYIFSSVYKHFDIATSPEITIEINPGTVTLQKLSDYRQAGVTRINIGVQSFSEHSLEFLSRIHTAGEAVSCVRDARRAGFENIGIDLIYGLPNQTETLWRADLESAIRFKPEHLSCYILTYENGTPIMRDLTKKKFTALSEDCAGDLFDITGQFLEENGYLHYEISNFANSNETRSLHNRKYWFHAPYAGFGPAAHSFINNRRFWNVRSVSAYIRTVKAGSRPVEQSEFLDQKQLMTEEIYLRLRCAEGISIKDFEDRFAKNFIRVFGSTASFFESQGYLQIGNDRCCLTRKGMRFSDSIASRFIDLI